MATTPPPDTPPQPSQPAHPDNPPPEIVPNAPDIDVPAPDNRPDSEPFRPVD